MGLKRVAVLLTCHNRKDKTVASLASLQVSMAYVEGVIYDVYLVDDASTDGTAKVIREMFPSVKIVYGNGKLFWNRGMHLAWFTASNAENKYDYFLWLNDDTLLLPCSIKELLECSEVLKDRAVICGSVRSQTKDEMTYGGRNERGTLLAPNGQIQNCSLINGNVVLISRSIYERIGNLDPLFPHAIGDFDYGQRALKMGFSAITTRVYVGYCESNPYLPKWCYQSVPFVERIRNLYSPLGNSHPYYFFIYERRHFGLRTAVKHFLSIHLRVLAPGLWK